MEISAAAFLDFSFLVRLLFGDDDCKMFVVFATKKTEDEDGHRLFSLLYAPHTQRKHIVALLPLAGAGAELIDPTLTALLCSALFILSFFLSSHVRRV